jgi:hypothetical protein
MPLPADTHLRILPGTRIVTFLVKVGQSLSAVVVWPADFLVGLRAARDLAAFGEVCQEDPLPEELLPWAGNV